MMDCGKCHVQLWSETQKGRINKNGDQLYRYPYKQPRVADEGDIVISQVRSTPIPSELTLVDATKGVRVDVTSVSVEESILGEPAPVTTLLSYST